MSGKKTPIDAPHLWLVLVRCHHALSHIAERSIKDTGLGLTDFAALEALLHKGPLSITEIQSKVPLALGSMTAAVDRLEEKGLILRTPSPKDRRAKILKLSPKGRSVVEAAFTRHAADLETVMAVLNQREKRQLHALLKRVGLFAAAARARRSHTGRPGVRSTGHPEAAGRKTARADRRAHAPPDLHHDFLRF